MYRYIGVKVTTVLLVIEAIPWDGTFAFKQFILSWPLQNSIHSVFLYQHI